MIGKKNNGIHEKPMLSIKGIASVVRSNLKNDREPKYF